MGTSNFNFVTREYLGHNHICFLFTKDLIGRNYQKVEKGTFFAFNKNSERAILSGVFLSHLNYVAYYNLSRAI